MGKMELLAVEAMGQGELIRGDTDTRIWKCVSAAL